MNDEVSEDGGAGRAALPAAVRDALPLAAGAGLAVAVAGAVLAFADLPSPLRAPCTVVFMVLAPALAVALWLRGLEPLGRLVASTTAALALNLLVAQAMLALRLWSTRGGIAAVAGISVLLFLLTLLRRRGGRTTRRQAP
ncbi:hypothetical protein ACIO3O_31235 [Streptomyces sp. NPDC087440]|uniref:hypothetical protein n=1 Tax=Streptomyces sp. NPDC087440 TaxID=3365790 RepID=UPI003810086F